jgi:1-acyl-sn-glycerol-3-phosphate acyltransferase
MPVDEVVLAPPQSVLKTSSGKLRRAASRELYERGGKPGVRAVWWQILRLSWSSILPQMRRSLRAGTDIVYGGYVLLLLGVLGLVTWALCAVLPRADWCWTVSRRMARLFLALSGMRLTVRGLEHVPRERAVMLAPNHSSYLDGLVVTAALDRAASFVAKRELLDHWIPRIFLQRLGAEFVERFDVQRGIEDAGKFAGALRGGKSLIVFPEGTFRRMPGLLPFRMGAFVIAAQAGAPLVPVVLRGTRSALREGQWLFRRTMISVTFCAPIVPQGSDWNAAIDLRDRARAEILRLCGEPDLNEETVLPPKQGASRQEPPSP